MFEILNAIAILLVGLCLAIALILTGHAQAKSKAYTLLAALFAFFFLLLLVFFVSRWMGWDSIGSFFETAALVVLLIFSFFHLKFEALENRGDY